MKGDGELSVMHGLIRGDKSVQVISMRSYSYDQYQGEGYALF